MTAKTEQMQDKNSNLTKITLKPEDYLNDDMHVKFFGVESNALVESRALTVVEVHCHVHLQDKIVNTIMIRENSQVHS